MSWKSRCSTSRADAGLVLLLLLFAAPALADDRRLPALGLPDARARGIPIPDGLERTVVLEDWIEIFHPPALTLPSDRPDAGPEEIEGAGVLVQTPFKLRLSPAARIVWQVSCDTGGSADPSCTLAEDRARGEPRLLNVPGEVFVVPGDGCLYVSRRTNAHVDLRRKFCEARAGLVEVPQPIHAVGLKSEALRDLALSADRALKRPGIRIPRGAPVEILAEDRGVYLLRDGFGLTGWIRLPTTRDPGGRGNVDIKGFFYAGD